MRHWESVSDLPTAAQDGAVTLNGSHSMGDGRIFLQISVPYSLMTTYRMNLISAGSVSLDSTFKKREVAAFFSIPPFLAYLLSFNFHSYFFPFRLYTLLVLSAPSLFQKTSSLRFLSVPFLQILPSAFPLPLFPTYFFLFEYFLLPVM